MARALSDPPSSALDHIIPPEIKGDAFYRWIERVASTSGVRNILEIGASSGAGSTEALVAGALRNPDGPPAIHCIEASQVRFTALVERYREAPFLRAYHASSIARDRFPEEKEVDEFRRRVWTRFRFIRRSIVMGWLRQDLEYLDRHGLSESGVERVRRVSGITQFDAVLIDGSEFSGPADLEQVHGARFLLLDDIRTFKNYDNHRLLLRDPRYRLVVRRRWLRNGFAIFERRA
jgi:hypothetical protein